MAITKFGIVASTVNAHIRRYVYPAFSNFELDAPSLVGPGEIMIRISNGPYASSAAWLAAVNAAVLAALGKAPGDPTCCVLDQTNTVVQLIMADAGIDSLPGMTLVQAYAPIPVGSTYDPATGLFTAPGYTTPANPAKGIAAVIVPPTLIPKP